MNKLIYITILILFCYSSELKAQENSKKEAKQLDHQKVVFENKEDGFLYWPEGLPVYIRLSALPDENAPSFLLDNVEGGNGTYTKSKDGIKLELTGNQYIRWINSVTNGETKFKFISDGDAPEISHDFNDVPKYTSGAKVFFGKGLKCTFNAKDKLSGLQETYVSIDGATYTPNKSPIDFPAEKDYFVQYYAVDKVGYFNKPNTVEFTVDITSPVTKHSIENNFIRDILSDETVIVLTSSDNISGVNAIYYKFDNQSKFSVYNGKIKINNLSNGDHKITYYSVDNVKNDESKQEYSFYLDKQFPNPDISIKGNMHKKGNETYVSAMSLVNFTATDDKIGVKEILYAINSEQKFIRFENPFPLSLQSGPFTVNYYSIDSLKNTSNKKSVRYQMDLVPPVTKFTISGPNYVQRSTTIWVTKDTKLSLSSTDAGAGLEKISFAIGNEKGNDYKDAIQVKEEGNFLCRFWGTDYVGNREGDNVLLLIVDNSAPEIKEIFSVSPVGKDKNKKGEEVDVYPQYTSLFLAATDMSSGLKDVLYSLNGSAEKKYSSAILMNDEGEYEIKIRAVDNLGHESSKSMKFKIRKLTSSDY